jgi:hypothetical protein
MFFAATFFVSAINPDEGFIPGDKAIDFSLKSVDGKINV